MGFSSPAEVTTHETGARQRILETAYELFSHRGIRGVGVEEVITQAGVAKATLYRHFPSKDDLVIAFLELREQRWTLGWVVTVYATVITIQSLWGWYIWLAGQDKYIGMLRRYVIVHGLRLRFATFWGDADREVIGLGATPEAAG